MYCFDLAMRGIKQPLLLTVLIAASIAVGISGSAAMMMVIGTLKASPMPSREKQLHHVQLDPRPLEEVQAFSALLPTITLHDARELMRADDGNVTATAAGWLPARFPDDAKPSRMLTIRGFTHRAPAMFGMQFISGKSWSKEDDLNRKRVAVISRSLALELFGNGPAVGRSFELATRSFTIIGVIADWNPRPRFHDLDGNAFARSEQVFIPLETWVALPQDYGNGRMRCWNKATNDVHSRDCAWLHLWAELETDSIATKFKAMVAAYAQEQIRLGRTNQARSEVLDVAAWLSRNEIVPRNVRMQAWLSLGILAVCLLNANGLLLAKFMVRRREFGARRALGATRAAIFCQCYLEAAAIGGIGGLLGVPLAMFALQVLRKAPAAYADHLQLSWSLLATSLVLAIGSSLIIGAIPAWKASRSSPVFQMRAS